MMPAPALVSQARWKQFCLPLLSSQKLGGGKVSKEGKFITWGRGKEILCAEILLQNSKSLQHGSFCITSTQVASGSFRLFPTIILGKRVAREADSYYLKLGLAYFPCDSTSEVLHY